MIRLGLPAKIAPSGIRPIRAGSKFAGPASTVVLDGYADRVLEGVYRSNDGDVLVLDNKGRSDDLREKQENPKLTLGEHMKKLGRHF